MCVWLANSDPRSSQRQTTETCQTSWAKAVSSAYKKTETPALSHTGMATHMALRKARDQMSIDSMCERSKQTPAWNPKHLAQTRLKTAYALSASSLARDSSTSFQQSRLGV